MIILILFWIIFAEHSMIFQAYGIFSLFLVFYLTRKLFVGYSIIFSIRVSEIVNICNLLKEIIISGIMTCRVILEKDRLCKPKFQWIDLESKSLNEQVIFANSITLTPGTMSVKLEGNRLLVHAINLKAMKTINTEK